MEMSAMVGLFLSGIVSYVVNQLPSLYNPDLEIRIEKCYQTALKKWCGNNTIRKDVARRKYNNVEALKHYITNEKGHIPAEMDSLSRFWLDEMSKDSVCYSFITETKIDKLQEGIEQMAETLSSIDESQNLILSGIEGIREEIAPLKEGQITILAYLELLVEKIGTLELSIAKLPMTSCCTIKGLSHFTPIEDYIPRSCCLENNQSSFYQLFKETKYRLLDYLLGCADSDKTQFILYSTAQFGKTTELNQLAYELKESGLYAPFLYEVKHHRELQDEHLPSEPMYEGKRVVLLIDALDEINGEKHECLLSVIGRYAKIHTEIPMVISCRKNYPQHDNLESFTPLFLQEIGREEARDYAAKKIENVDCFVQQLTAINLWHLALKPFFLKELIRIYNEQGELPTEAIAIYDSYIKKAFAIERKTKRVLDDSFTNRVLTEKMQNMATVMLIMGLQQIKIDEARSCMEGKEILAECVRLDLVQEIPTNEGEPEYTFINNAIKEYLAAELLATRSLGKVKKIVTLRDGSIKPEWYHVLILYFAFLKQQNQVFDPIVEWLKESNLEMITKIDKKLVSDEVRNEIFKAILLKYKELGIRFPNFTQSDYKEFMEFADSEDTLLLIIDELSASQPHTPYQSILLALCGGIDWGICFYNRALYDGLLLVLKEIYKRLELEGGAQYPFFLFLGHSHFHTAEHASSFYDLLKESNHYESVIALIQLFYNAKVVDDYLDYILEKESLVRNQREGDTTISVSRRVVYRALGSVKREECVKRVLQYFLNQDCMYDSNEGYEYVAMIKELLHSATKYYLAGSSYFKYIVSKLYLLQFGTYFSSSNDKANTLLSYQLFAKKTGFSLELKSAFTQLLQSLSADGTRVFVSPEEKHSQFLALWLTHEELDEIFSQFNSECSIDKRYANWLLDEDLEGDNSHTKKLYYDKYPEENEWIIKQKEKRQACFDEMCNYEQFKNSVLKAFKREKDNPSADAGKYVNAFVNQSRGLYNRQGLDHPEEAIENENYYNSFVMRQLDELLNRHPYEGNIDNIQIDEMTICRVGNDAADLLEKLANHPSAYSRNEDCAIKLLLKGIVKIDKLTLFKLLRFSMVSITRLSKEGWGAPYSYTLFDYLKEHHAGKLLIDALLLEMKRIVHDYTIAARHFIPFSRYLLEHGSKEGDGIILERIQQANSTDRRNLISNLPEKHHLEPALLSLSKELDFESRHLIYRYLIQQDRFTETIEKYLVEMWEGSACDNEKSIVQLLLCLGNQKALTHAFTHPEVVEGFYFVYNTIESVTLLCSMLRKIDRDLKRENWAITSIIDSLREIALMSKTNLERVLKELEDLQNRDESLKWLNSYKLSFNKAFHAKHQAEITCQEALNLIKTNQV